MSPTDVVVISLDGKVHRVASRSNITIGVPTGAVVMTNVADPADPSNITQAEIRQPGPVNQVAGTRFTCGCGLSFDAQNGDLGSDPRWTQGLTVDCANGC